MYYITKVCFMCFNYTNIENYTILEHAGNEIVQQVKFVLPEIANLEPRLPLFICSTCRQALDNFHNFKNTCIDHVNKLQGLHGSSKATFAELQLKIHDYKSLVPAKEEENIDTKIKPEENMLEDEINIKEDFTEELSTSEDNTDSFTQQIFKNETQLSLRQHSDRKMTDDKNNSSELVTNDFCLATDFKCLVCNAKFVEKSHLQNHMMVHYNVKQRKCFICDKMFKAPSNLHRHMITHTDVKDYKCVICNKMFAQHSHLKQHVAVHTCVKDYKCFICNKLFGQKSLLKRHMIVHTGVKDYKKCSICNKLFAQNSTLFRHMRVHNGVKNYKCSICNKLFSQNTDLKRHMAVHTGVKNYKCSLCNQKFSQNSNLKQHMAVHTGTKDYMCSICNMFLRKNDLKKHMTTHTGVKEYECFMCNKKFVSKRYLNVHVKRHENNKTK